METSEQIAAFLKSFETPGPNHNLSHLIATLNEKAQAAGSDVRASYWRQFTYGESCGVKLTGSPEGIERASRYVSTYYTKHLDSRRSLSSQWHYIERTEKDGSHIIDLVYYPE